MMGPTGTQNLFSARFCAIVLTFYFVSTGAYAAELFPYDSHTEILENEDDGEDCFTVSNPLFVTQQQYNFICVGVNGYISFASGKLDSVFSNFPVNVYPIIAAIWFDFADDEESKILQAIVTAPSDTQLFTETIKLVDEDFQTDLAFVATWEEIKIFGKDSRCTFQTALVADITKGKTYSIFNYQKMELERSIYTTGYNYGDGRTYAPLPGVDDFNFEAEVLLKSNVGIPGRYVMSVNGTAYGPSSVKLSPLDDLMALCPAETDTIDVYCEVDVDNVFPQASVVLRVPSTGDLEPTHKTHENESVRNHFQVKPRTSGTVVLICVATNSLRSTIMAENQAQFTFHALQESYNPVLTIEDLPVSNNSIQLVGQPPQQVSCSIGELVPGFVTVSLECGDYSNQSQTNVTFVTIKLTPSNNQSDCACHVSGCSEETTQATIQLSYGPSSARLSSLGGVMALCPAETDTIDVYCEVDVDNVFPQASVVLRVPSTGDLLEPTHKTHENDSVRNHFQVKPRTSGTVVLICVATNTLNSTIFAENQTQFTFHALQENYNPVLTIGDLPVSHNSTQLVGRQPHLVSCSINETVAGYVALSLECGDESSRLTYNVTSVTVELTPSNNQSRCVCHVSGCSEDTTQATLQLAYGPSSVIHSLPKEVFELCPLNQDSIDVSCEVQKEDFFPMTSVRLQVLPTRELEPTSSTENESSVIHYFKYRPLNTGMLMMKCIATNTLDPSIVVNNETHVTAYAPARSPILYVDNQQTQNSSIQNILLGQTVNVTCGVEDVGSGPIELTLTCGDLSVESHPETASSVFEVTKDIHQTVCTCQVGGCFAETRNFMIHVAYGPTSTPLVQASLSSFNLCPSEDTLATVYCDVDVADVQPQPRAMLRGLSLGQLESTDVLLQNNVYRYVFSGRPMNSGNLSLTCVVENVIFQSLSQEGMASILVYTPPTDVPVVEMNGSPITSESVQAVMRGENVSVLCNVSGGFPQVSSVTVECTDDAQTSSETSNNTSVNFVTTMGSTGMTCTCGADHVTGCDVIVTEFYIKRVEAKTTGLMVTIIAVSTVTFGLVVLVTSVVVHSVCGPKQNKVLPKSTTQP